MTFVHIPLGDVHIPLDDVHVPLGKHATVFQAEVYAILACVYEIETQDKPEKYVSVCSDNQAALKALQAAKTTSPLIQQLNDIST